MSWTDITRAEHSGDGLYQNLEEVQGLRSRSATDGVPVPGLLSELEAIIRESGINLAGHGLEHVLQKLPGGASVHPFNELGFGELTHAVDAYEEMELSLRRLDFSNINVKEPDGVALELLTLRLFPLDFGQARDAMPLQRRSRQMRNGDCRA